MTRIVPRLLAFLPPALSATSAAVTIFDGATLNAWEGNPAVRRVEDSAITGEIRAGGALRENAFIAFIVRAATETINVPKGEGSGHEVRPQSLMPPGRLRAPSDRDVIELPLFLTDHP